MKTVIITGGTRGIGADIARVFLGSDYKVVIGARNRSGLAEETQEQLIFCEFDVREESGHQKLIQTALDWGGSLECFINCAGFSKWSPVTEVDENFWNMMVDINLKGTFLGCKTASKHLASGGSIINVSSLAGKRGSANNSVYCATKFGVNGITQSLAKELGPRGIRVNAICPVYVETPGLLEALENTDSPPAGKDTSKYLQNFAHDQAALKRLPLGNEVADICYYLASDTASAVTGQCINIDCGVLPQ